MSRVRTVHHPPPFVLCITLYPTVTCLYTLYLALRFASHRL